MYKCVPIFLLILLNQESVDSIRLVELRVPSHAAEGGQALLGCQFDLEGDSLYSVKWYKDGREFYRYVPNNKNPVYHFPMQGVHVDVSRSSSTEVALTRLSKHSAGEYRCEVSGEAPSFMTVAKEKHIIIHHLPASPPEVTGLEKHYNLGDFVHVNCTSPASRPEAQLKWMVNAKPAPSNYLRGPWHRSSIERPGLVETTLELSFIVTPGHLRSGSLKLKCQSSIAPLYQEESSHVSYAEPEPSVFNLDQESDPNLGSFEKLSDSMFDLPDEQIEDNAHTDTAAIVKTSLSTLLLLQLMLQVFE